MPRRVAFCLVENKSGEVLLVQRGYGKEKYKWSLPGGHVDHNERSHRAAVRETREETGPRVKIISTVLVGRPLQATPSRLSTALSKGDV